MKLISVQLCAAVVGFAVATGCAAGGGGEAIAVQQTAGTDGTALMGGHPVKDEQTATGDAGATSLGGTVSAADAGAGDAQTGDSGASTGQPSGDAGALSGSAQDAGPPPFPCADVPADPNVHNDKDRVWQIYTVQPGHCLSAGSVTWSGTPICVQYDVAAATCTALCGNHQFVKVELFRAPITIAILSYDPPLQGSLSDQLCENMQDGLDPSGN